VTIDDNEGHYLKVVMDDVFGRPQFVANAVWEKVYTPKSNGRGLSSDHDHLLVFSKSDRWLDTGWNVLPRSPEQRARFTNPDNDPNGSSRTYPLDVRTEDGARREKYRYEVELPSGRKIRPSAGRHWSLPQEEFERQRRAGEIYFGKDGNAMPTRKVYLKDAKEGVIARTWWTYKEVGGNQDAKREVLALFGDSGFITPKPEALVQRALTIATNRGDLVLDSFLGSGTTAAVAHKMSRRWIGIEMGEHARTHCLPRLKKVVDGEQGGISEAVGWQGGGGFRFAKLGEPAFDATGRIHTGIRFSALAAYVWFLEAGAPHATGRFDSPLLGNLGETAVFLLYNGILGDRRPGGGNVLTHTVLDRLIALTPEHRGARIVYGEASRISAGRLKDAGVAFRQIPYDIRMR